MSEALVVSLVGAVPLTLAAIPGLVLLRRTKTNHGRNIGQHVEDLVDWAGSMTDWAYHHQVADNRVSEFLGVPPVPAPPLPRKPGPVEHTEVDTV